jgi:hypothetical protein
VLPMVKTIADYARATAARLGMPRSIRSFWSAYRARKAARSYWIFKQLASTAIRARYGDYYKAYVADIVQPDDSLSTRASSFAQEYVSEPAHTFRPAFFAV